MSSQDKMLAILDAFSADAPVWSAEELSARFELTPSTCYRYLKSLHQAGLLARVGSGSYVVGPRVLALDRIARVSDPVYSVGSPIVAALSRRTGFSALLSVLYSDSVMCVQQVATDDAPPGLFGRGQQRPPVAGATANIILAHLPPHQLRSVFGKQAERIAAAGLGKDWETLRAKLAAIRQQGYSFSLGEYRAGIATWRRRCSTRPAKCWAASRWRRPRSRRGWRSSGSSRRP
ncbi:helix-turn-helix domain-containing protein [Ramlibacter terrae]|uniref:Helix-turn-helix domain-containing protein n=1 Tax=Ramlibacter terrae TaxID=2732511 RepID=A0ABX6P171_9BURK|nr:helix-turn-helix domain-containing protein [Ramlibacter terrae]